MCVNMKLEIEYATNITVHVVLRKYVSNEVLLSTVQWLPSELGPILSQAENPDCPGVPP